MLIKFDPPATRKQTPARTVLKGMVSVPSPSTSSRYSLHNQPFPPFPPFRPPEIIYYQLRLGLTTLRPQELVGALSFTINHPPRIER